ncbi:acyl-CoA reductase [Desulfofustis limnaeus]|uniref:long-chain-fatty-acyl-CoA reductase n=1 Tax=Desulfofustis limnaeus TaxID=2740163 RepID=A0ABN6M967_9BACT|nr:acyl-CoA reductase [Desulfofustis limnaeus]MDX9896059.1 acyl-CoA reductase [Desulfofustis sp.]BDD88093.1 hypothetical protein DPPLL_24580 [Desulfofustis limnaeus]
MEFYLFGSCIERNEPVDETLMRQVLHQAREVQTSLQSVDHRAIIDLLDALADRWQDPQYPYRRQALEQLPTRIRFSVPMIEAGIDTMIGLLRKENLYARLDCDLGDRRFLQDWTMDSHFNGLIKAQPLGIVAHVSAGNVFVGGVDSLIQGIVTKNVNIMKMSTVDPLFPVLFARSLLDLDSTGVVGRSLALLTWKGGDESVEEVLKQHCDGIVVYGGKQTVHSYRHHLGLHTRLIEYGPKYSFVLVDKTELHKRGLKNTAHQIARDGVMWEQSACSSPHVVYINDRQAARELLEALAESFEEWAGIYPPGPLTDDEATEITKVRELARAEKALGVGDYRFSPHLSWTIVIKEDDAFETSCLHRTLLIKPVANLDVALAAVEQMGHYIQTVALVTDEKTARTAATRLANHGADRFVEPGRMAVRKHGTPHDGTRGLAELVRWVSLARDQYELPVHDCRWRPYSAEEDRFDFIEPSQRQAMVLSRLTTLVEQCRRQSPLLTERYGSLSLASFDDFLRFPLMTGSDYRDHLPPYGDGLLTGPVSGGYTFSSGGTTGRPKLVYRTHEEQQYNAARLGKGLALSVFHPGDTVANLLFAGNLWASFVSYNQALEHTGCRILPISGNLAIESIVAYLRLFKPNGAITIPSVLLGLAAHVEQHRITDIRLEKVATGGEHLFAGAREYLQRVLGISIFASTGYTTNDTGAIGYQCQACQHHLHHVHEDLHYVEILHPETLAPVAVGEIGKIVVTNLQRILMPTIRYDVGDLGRWVDTPCPCGRTTRLFELLGRADDVLIIGGGNVQPETVAAAVHDIDGLSEQFQMVAELAGHLDRLVIRVERSGPHQRSNEELARSLLAQIYQTSKEVKEMVRQRLAAEPRIEILPEGGLERNPKTGKIRLSIDRR